MNERNNTTADDEFVENAKRLFDESVDKLDGETRSKLNRGRQVAFAKSRSGSRDWRQWTPVGGIAIVAVAALVVWTAGSRIDPLDTAEVTADMEILLTEDSFEMLEDLEFYSWIEFDDESTESSGSTNNVG